jgi:hypothetical protein
MTDNRESRYTENVQQRLLVCDLVKAERDGEILIEVSDSDSDVLNLAGLREEKILDKPVAISFTSSPGRAAQ